MRGHWHGKTETARRENSTLVPTSNGQLIGPGNLWGWMFLGACDAGGPGSGGASPYLRPGRPLPGPSCVNLPPILALMG
jgi:hypothetical protein